ncbi:MAG TPA: protease pro-enzyme activation domain-containing protein, partial [Gemmataceae bacterium]|nr:protease pro-enzyme activation domain-containing protein [Gemmataceae bacterium]
MTTNKLASFSLLALLLLLAAFCSGARAASNLVSLPGHVPENTANLIPKGELPGSTSLQLAIGLPLRNEAALDDLIAQLYDPNSTNFHKFLTCQEFTTRFGPTEEDYQALIKFAEDHGLAIVGRHPNRVVLDVRGTSTDIGSAFNVTFKTYRHPTEARDFYAPNVEPSIPSNLRVRDMWGLSDYGRPQPLVLQNNSAKATATPLNYNGSGPSGNYQGRDFRNAYVPGTTLTGAGQIAAVAEFDGYFADDIANYESQIGYSSVPLQNILIDGVSGSPGYSGLANAVLEVSLDIEMMISMAPGLTRLIVYEGASPYDVFNRIVTDNSAKQISCSWSFRSGPGHNWIRHTSGTTLDSQLKQMVTQGQAFFEASGDSCAYTAG